MSMSGAACCAPGEQATLRLKPSRHAFVQVARVAAMLNGVMLKAGDGAAISQEEILEFKAIEGAAEMLLFDLA
jgi:quercetin 2,3-dioxygenase